MAVLPPLKATSQQERQKLALRWQYIVRQRERWSSHPTSRLAIAELAKETLEELGVHESFYAQITKADRVVFDKANPPSRVLEVEIPWKSEAIDWDLRIFPWEHLLSAATRDLRGDDPITIVRYLHVPKRRSVQSKSILPCLLRTFRAGRNPSTSYMRSIAQSLGNLAPSIDASKLAEYKPSTADECLAMLKQIRPSWLHVSGMHHSQGISENERSESPGHGCLFGTNDENIEWLYPLALAKSLNPTGRKLKWLTLDFYNSAARVAPLSIAQGAQSVLGFEHSFDEKAAELFFMRLYRCLAEDPAASLSAFVQALQEVKSEADRIRGCGIVLWSDRSLLDETQPRTHFRPSLNRVFGTVTSNSLQATTHRSPMPWISIEVEPEPKINYALLHNRFSILRKLSLRLDLDHQADFDEIRNLQILVQLETGSPQIPYQTQVTLSRQSPVVHLVTTDSQSSPDHFNSGIHIPLLSAQLRSLRETIQSTILVQIRWQNELLHSQTYPVDLCPIGEWRYQSQEISLLPSFVLPTDPAIPSIIQSAQPFLASLQDTFQAAFDGTQSVSDQEADPNRWLPIDDQVRAIWNSLTLSRSLHYVNPPPSYGEYVQRLRTPSQVLREGRGTCIDLAILVASCLEWIDLPSVLFLLDDHAFPGYWRDLDAMLEFNQPQYIEDREPTAPFREAVSSLSAVFQSSSLPFKTNRTAQEIAPHSFASPWFFDRSTYREIRELVLQRKLIPIETTAIARKSGFFEACDEAVAYFQSQSPRSFHSMLDITRSRSSVTPLPMIDQETTFPHPRTNTSGGQTHGD